MSYTNTLSTTNLASIVGSAIGAFGASIVVLSCYRYQKLSRSLSRKLIASQSLAHLIETVSVLFLPSTCHTTCVLQGVIEEYAVCSGIFWGCLMTYLLVLLTRTQIGNVAAFQSDQFMFTARLFGWVLPLSLSLSPLVTEDYSRDSGGWCWFKDSSPSGRFYRLFHYSIVTLCVIFISVFSLRIYFGLTEIFPDQTETRSPLEFPPTAPSESPHHSPTNNSSQEDFSLRLSSGTTDSSSTFPFSLSSISSSSWRQLPTVIRGRLKISVPETRNKLMSRLIYFPIVLVVRYHFFSLSSLFFSADMLLLSDTPSVLGSVRNWELFSSRDPPCDRNCTCQGTGFTDFLSPQNHLI
jgi:hypothetical protein